ncbi:MAG: AAA family ATPase [Bacilli bacterium]|nr:AAA family ATPase [Bacilli bacterium]
MYLGSSDFLSLRKGGLYIDKTDILDEFAPLLQSSTSLIVNRPRRFGKSLMISMIETFYSMDADSDPYFQDLKIAQSPNYVYRNQYPVITLSFKNISSVVASDMMDEIYTTIATIYKKWLTRVLPCCNEEESKYIHNIASKHAQRPDYIHSFEALSRFIYKTYGKKPLILIDEYDAPIEASYGSEHYNDILLFLKSFYLATFKDTDSFGFGYISGVFGIAKGTLGTGLNNIPVDSGQTSPLSKNYFGFNEEEIDQLCEKFHLDEQTHQNLKKYYGGYEFLGGIYYNPWSVLSFIANRAYSSYWGNTGSNKAFSKVVAKAHDFDMQFLTTIAHEGMDASLDFTSSYEDVGKDLSSILLYLALAGYLSLHPTGFNRYHLSLPNEEAKQCFVNEIIRRYEDQSSLSKAATLRKAIETGDGEKLSEFFTQFLLSSLSYYDFSDEKNYQIMVGTIAALLFEDCMVKYEVIAGAGRCDIEISPFNKGGFGAVIEIKYVGSKTSKQRIADRAKAALNQIKKSDYVQHLRIRGANPIIAFGFAFHKNMVCVESERLDQ